MSVKDPRKYYVEECYALTNCMHCPDCLAFGVKYFNQASLRDKEDKKKSCLSAKATAIKFIISTISSENLPCEKALSFKELKSYVNKLLNKEAELPICHYELR